MANFAKRLYYSQSVCLIQRMYDSGKLSFQILRYFGYSNRNEKARIAGEAPLVALALARVTKLRQN